MFSSLRSRLIISYVTIILITLLATLLTLAILLRTVAAQLVQSELRNSLRITVSIANNLARSNTPLPQALDLLQQRQDRLGEGVDGNSRTLILDQQGTVLADLGPGDSLLDERFLLAPQVVEQQQVRQVRSSDGRRWYLAGQTIALSGGNGPSRRVIIAQLAPVRGVRALLGRASGSLLWVGGLSFLIAAILALVIARSVSRPLAHITQATEAIAKGDFSPELAADPGSPREIRRLATSFRHMARQVAASQEAQRAFIANVSHDLKTPLTSIQGFAQALMDGTAGTAEAQQQAVEVIHDESNRMGRLVDQLLDLARLEVGEVIMHPEAVDLAELLSECCQRMQLRADNAHVTLHLTTTDVPPLIADRDRLIQVFSNLLDNALKVTRAGDRIDVNLASREGERRSAPWVDVTVSDTGPGIPEQDLPRLFERFYQVDKSRPGKRSGAGLGLAIVREIVQSHQGTVQVESIEGSGTRITVSLPTQSELSTPADPSPKTTVE